MTTWWALVWGLAGGLCFEALELYGHIRRTDHWSWRRPIPQGMDAFLARVTIRATAGAIVAAASAASGQVAGAFGAFALGIAAPIVIERVAGQMFMDTPPTDGSRFDTGIDPASPNLAAQVPTNEHAVPQESGSSVDAT